MARIEQFGADHEQEVRLEALKHDLNVGFRKISKTVFCELFDKLKIKYVGARGDDSKFYCYFKLGACAFDTVKYMTSEQRSKYEAEATELSLILRTILVAHASEVLDIAHKLPQAEQDLTPIEE